MLLHFYQFSLTIIVYYVYGFLSPIIIYFSTQISQMYQTRTTCTCTISLLVFFSYSAFREHHAESSRGGEFHTAAVGLPHHQRASARETCDGRCRGKTQSDHAGSGTVAEVPFCYPTHIIGGGQTRRQCNRRRKRGDASTTDRVF